MRSRHFGCHSQTIEHPCHRNLSSNLTWDVPLRFLRPDIPQWTCDSLCPLCIKFPAHVRDLGRKEEGFLRTSATYVRCTCCSSVTRPFNDTSRSKAKPTHTTSAYATYFEKREADHMAATFRGTQTLRFLWKFQRGICPVCSIRITRITGWRLHHRVPRVMGGSKSAENRVLLHPECHDRVHRQGISVSLPRLPERGVQWA
jgi:hypothetical protein